MAATEECKKRAFNRFDVSISDSIFRFSVLRDGIEIKVVESYHNTSILGSPVLWLMKILLFGISRELRGSGGKSKKAVLKQTNDPL